MKKLWNSITLLGHQKLKDPSDLRQLKLLNSISALGAFNLLLLIPAAIIMEVPQVVISVIIGALLAFVTLLLNARGLFQISRIYFFGVTQLFLVILLVTMSGKDGGTQIVFIMSGALHLVLFRGTRWAIPLFLFVMLLMGISAYWIENHESYLDHLTDTQKRVSYYLNIVSCMILVFAMILHFKNAATEYEATITEQNKNISEKNKDILDSITYARRLQEAILPPDSFIKQHLPESFVFYQPKDIVAGDFYWMETVSGANADHVLIAAADCTGHGVPGAMVSVVCSNALNRSVKEFGITEPAKILDKTCELVIDTFAKSESEIKDGMDISLISLKFLSSKVTESSNASKTSNPDTISIEWAGANNPLWIVKEGKLTELKADKQPIGSYIATKPFTNHKLELKRGDTLFIFTDGFADQFGGEKGKKYKYKQLAAFLKKNSNLSSALQHEKLQSEFSNWKGDLEQLDDVCVIGIRI